MSHFSLLVTVDGAVKEADIVDAVTKLLAPFDEQTEVPQYVSNTKEELIANQRKEIEEYRDGVYADYLTDPVKYEAECRNPNHMRYLTAPAKSADENAAAVATLNDSPNFSDKLLMLEDDAALYAEAIRWLEPEELNAEGEQVSTYNPKSQWDWWVIGGRWANFLNQIPNGSEDTQWGKRQLYRDGKNILRRRDLRSPQSTFATLTKDGEWHESGSMGWFGMSSGNKEEADWDKEVANQLLATPGEDWLVVVDCHI